MNVVGIAVIPAAPILVTGLTGTATPALDVRAAALAAIGDVLRSEPEFIVMIAQGDRDAHFDESASLHLHRLGGMQDDRPSQHSSVMPLSLAIGTSLLRDAGWTGPFDGRLADAAMSSAQAQSLGRHLCADSRRLGVLLLANASACSSAAAPGSWHEGSEAFNADVLEVIRTRDSQALTRLTQSSCREQLSDAFVPMHVLAGLTSETDTSTVHHAGEFRGVQHMCASILPTRGSRKAVS